MQVEELSVDEAEASQRTYCCKRKDFQRCRVMTVES
jgi:hypothetical protein